MNKKNFIAENVTITECYYPEFIGKTANITQISFGDNGNIIFCTDIPNPDAGFSVLWVDGISGEPYVMYVDQKVSWEQERTDKNDNNDGFHFGIYTYEVPIEEVDTDNMLNNEVINVEWFKTEKKRDRIYKSKPYKNL